MIRRTVIYRGTVQGVGFRWTAARTARGYSITGYVRNRRDGAVELVAEGDIAAVTVYLQALEDRMADYIHDSEVRQGPATGEFKHFDIAV